MRKIIVLLTVFIVITKCLVSQNLEVSGFENQFGFKYDKEWFRVINRLKKKDFSGRYRFESGTERNIMLYLNCIDGNVLMEYYITDVNASLGEYRKYYSLNDVYVSNYQMITNLFKLEFYRLDSKAYLNKIKEFHDDLGNNYSEDDEIDNKVDTILYITPDFFYSQTLGFKCETTDINAFFKGIYPEVCYRKLTDEELFKKTKQELRIMRNELFARYGHEFQEGGEMDRYFRKQDWYYPYRKGEDVSKHFSFLEKFNLKKIIEYERKK